MKRSLHLERGPSNPVLTGFQFVEYLNDTPNATYDDLSAGAGVAKARVWELFRGAPGIRIQPAPFPEGLEYGLAMIREWLQDKALDVPDARYPQTELRSQLERMTAKNMSFVADALRFLIGGFVQWKQRQAVSAQVDQRPFYFG